MLQIANVLNRGINTYNPSEIEVETNFDSVSDQTSWIPAEQIMQSSYIDTVSATAQSQAGDGQDSRNLCSRVADPETIIRGHNHHAHESMSPDSMTSASSLYSSSASPSPVEMQYIYDSTANTRAVAGINISLDTTRLALNGGDLDPISQPILSDFIHPMPQVGSTTDKVSGLSDIWLTSTFMEI